MDTRNLRQVIGLVRALETAAMAGLLFAGYYSFTGLIEWIDFDEPFPFAPIIAFACCLAAGTWLESVTRGAQREIVALMRG